MRMHALLHRVGCGRRPCFIATLLVVALAPPAAAREADLILYNGKVVTADKAFSVHQAVAVAAGRIMQVADNDTILKLGGPQTKKIDLRGKMVLPGLIDSHTHPTGAAMYEFDHTVPDMRSIDDVLAYVRQRAQVLDEGEWINISQVFITRLKERRYPTRAELDEAAPKHPVLFQTGPDGSLNSLALKLSGIDKDLEYDGSGRVERDEHGEPTGILRSCLHLVRSRSPKSGKTAAEQDRYALLKKLLADYNSVGLTAIADRNASGDAIERFQRLRDNGDLTVRIAASHGVGTGGNVDAIKFAINKVAEKPLVRGKAEATDMLRIVGLKIFLDGGMLTGSARMRKPWGLSTIYSIDDAAYKGVFRTDPEKLAPIVTVAVEHGLQFTAHSVGDGAVHALLDAYEQVSKTHDIAKTRPCITHSNFMSKEAVQQMARLGVVADIQPAWLWLDAATLEKQFGVDRLRYFQPLKTIFEHNVIAGGGSDHMQKIGSMRAVNPYNPFLGMWITMARQARDSDLVLHKVEALSREQAIRFYTINNAYITFLDDKAGSIEPGKYADLIVIDRDLLTCPLDDVRKTEVLQTYLEGKLVYERK